jgi:RecA/RadA recombinase
MEDLDFLNTILKDAGIKEADTIVTTNFIDTGAYALNALLSGSIYRGIPGNRVVMFAGQPSAGKTYLILSCIKTYMDSNPKAFVLYFDTEFALELDMLENRGIDTQRFKIIPTDTLQDFRSKALKILNSYESAKKKPQVLFALDSLSNLPTNKEVADSTAGSDTRDMTKAQIIRSIFRVLTNKLGNNEIPMLIANHVYSSMDMYSPVVISGGGGALYAASTIITLTKAKLKEGDEVVGNVLRATTYKSRYSKEQQKAELRLDFKKGLDRYYGLLPIAEEAKLIVKKGRKYELPDGRLVWEREINKEPEKVFTKEILDLIDEACKKKYLLGGGDSDDEEQINIDYAAEDTEIDQESSEE